MSILVAQPRVEQPLNLITSFIASRGALYETLLALAACHGGQDGPWLDELEASFIRNTKNVNFSGVRMEAETAAVEAALRNLQMVVGSVRRRLHQGSTSTGQLPKRS